VVKRGIGSAAAFGSRNPRSLVMLSEALGACEGESKHPENMSRIKCGFREFSRVRTLNLLVKWHHRRGKMTAL
jgi:hypothetical protein